MRAGLKIFAKLGTKTTSVCRYIVMEVTEEHDKCFNDPHSKSSFCEAGQTDEFTTIAAIHGPL